MDFLTELKKRILVLDGSMGALLQNRGLPNGMAPDVWMMDNPEIILRAHQDYTEAGADILLTNTFGASRYRLEEYQSYSRIREINARAVDFARQAIGAKGFVAGDIGPSGETIFPTGKKSFEEVFEIFYEQAKILIECGVDLIVVETIFDSLEFKVALSAVRAASATIPLLAHATFNTDGVTDTGASAENIFALAQGFKATGVGVNCSTGPEPMVKIIEKMADFGSLYLSVQPNAGLPQMKAGKTFFPMDASALSPFVDQFIRAGANIIGGCCGTTPDYIRLVKQKVLGAAPRAPRRRPGVLVSSLSQCVRIGGEAPFVGIGERMNPSGRKKLSESLKRGELSLLLEDADVQTQSGARMLDLNVGVPLMDEPALMQKAVVAVQNKFDIPLMIDSANSFALESGGSVYYGRPLLNSINAEDEKIHELLPILKRQGGAVVCMTTGVEVPELAKDRVQNAIKIAEILFQNGFAEEDLVFDCLGLVVSAMQNGSRETLNTIRDIKARFPYSATTLGLSNVSFGLPNRAIVHNAFLSLATYHGLDSAIMSVTQKWGTALARASTMWTDKPKSVESFMTEFAEPIGMGGAAPAVETPKVPGAKIAEEIPLAAQNLNPLEKSVFFSIVEGQKEKVVEGVKEFTLSLNDQNLALGMQFFLQVMTPAIRHLGNLFAARKKFIPHLIAAADAMKAGVEVLEPYLIKARAACGTKKGTIIFATVKGDIHDIGKNICVLMLRNFGFEVVDLGRNVDPELILQTALEKNAQVVALSALMTTTMIQMKVVIDRVKEQKLPFKVVIGGAVVTPDFAREIASDGFSTDVGTVVTEMERVLALMDAATV